MTAKMVIATTVLRRILGLAGWEVINSAARAAGMISRSKQAMKYRGARTEGRTINQVITPIIAEIVTMKSGLFITRLGLGKNKASGKKASTRGVRFPSCAQ